MLDYEHWARSCSRFLGSRPAGDISHKPSARLPLLSIRPAVTSSSKDITPLGWYQIILLGDRGTQVAQEHYAMVSSQDSNPQSVNRKSDALPIALLHQLSKYIRKAVSYTHLTLPTIYSV